MQFHCLIYFDPQKIFDGSPESNAALAEIGPHTAELKARGHYVASYPLNLPKEAITVQVKDGKKIVHHTKKVNGKTTVDVNEESKPAEAQPANQ